VPETLLGSLVLGRPFGVAAALTPRDAVDESLGGPVGGRLGAVGGSVIKDPLDRLVLLLQTLVEQTEVTEVRDGERRPAGLGGRRWRCVRHDGGLQLVVGAEGAQAMLLAHDAIRLMNVGPEELAKPCLHGNQSLIFVKTPNVRLKPNRFFFCISQCPGPC
jgi:hypothetical protein